MSRADRFAKHSALEEHEVLFAFGDSEGDIDMLKMAKYPFCINPTAGLLDVAQVNGWPVFAADQDGLEAAFAERISG